MPVKLKDVVVGQVYWVLDAQIYAKERFARSALRASFYAQCKGYEVEPMLCIQVQGDSGFMVKLDQEQLARGVTEFATGDSASQFGWGRMGWRLNSAWLAEREGALRAKVLPFKQRGAA
jgi:hypothetical protein